MLSWKLQQSLRWINLIQRLVHWKMPFAVFRSGSGASDLCAKDPRFQMVVEFCEEIQFPCPSFGLNYTSFWLCCAAYLNLLLTPASSECPTTIWKLLFTEPWLTLSFYGTLTRFQMGFWSIPLQPLPGNSSPTPLQSTFPNPKISKTPLDKEDHEHTLDLCFRSKPRQQAITTNNSLRVLGDCERILYNHQTLLDRRVGNGIMLTHKNN